MRRIASLIILLAFVCLAGTGAAEEIPGIGPVGDVEKIQGDFQFTEGPASDGAGHIYFTDIPANKIHRYHLADGKISTFLDPSGHANGLMFNAAGKLFACQMDGQLVSIDVASKKVAPVAAKYDGTRFNAPNDLVLDKQGGVYFTDPLFRAPKPLPQEVQGVYYASADGEVTRVFESDKAPNGVILSPDEKTLYVVPSMQKEMLAFDVEAPGKLGQPRVLCSLKQPEGAMRSTGGDGLTIDTRGNLYITSRLGIQVFTPGGKLLGVLEFPEQPANVCFGGKEMDTLYVTARNGFYRLKTKAQGHVFPGK